MITRLNARRLLKPLLSATAMLAFASPAFGQTWNGGGGNGNWSTAANWSTATVPVSAATTVLALGGTVQTITTNDLTSPFSIRSLTVNNTASAGTGFTVNGGTLQFPATATGTRGIFNNSNKVLKLNSNVIVNTPITFGLNSNDPLGAEIILSGSLSGTGAITAQPGTTPATVLVLTSKNNVNFTGTWLQKGTSGTSLGAANALFRGTAVTLEASGNSLMFAGTLATNGNGLGDVGHNQQLGSIDGLGQFLLGTSGAATAGSTVLAGYLDNDMNLNGSGSISGTNANAHFGKVGLGILTLDTVNNAFSAGMSVRQGTIQIASVTGNGSIVGNNQAQYTVYGGAQFRLDNGAALDASFAQGRLSNLANIVTAGGKFRFDGSATADASNTEVVNSLSGYAGLSVVAVNQGPGQFARVNFNDASASFVSSTLTRGGQIGFAGQGLGAGTGANQTGVTFAGTAMTSQVVGGILPFALSQDNYVSDTAGPDVVFNPNTFATIGANGIAPLTTFDASNVLATGATVLPTTINSLVIGTGGSATANGTTVTAGAILSRVSAGTVSGSGLTTTGRFYLSSSNTGSLIVTAPISAAGVSTTGTVNAAAVTLTGTSQVFAVNSGTTTLGSPVTGTTVVYQVSSGATLAVPAAFTVNGTLRGSGTVTGAVTIASGGLIGGTSLAGDNSAGQAPGTLTINGALSLNAGSNFRFYINSVHGDTAGSTTNGQWTQAKILATSLDLTTATTGSITIQPWSLDLKNSVGNAPIYDWDNTQTYNWVLGTFSGGINGFSADKFVVNTNFQNFATNNPLGAGSFSVEQQGTNLVLNFNPIPEPALLGLGVVGVLAVIRRRKA